MRSSALTNKKLIGARDPLGIRPLVLGELDGALHPGLGDLRARHHRRALRPRRRERRGRGDLRGGHRIALPLRRRSRRGPASSNTSISRGPDFDRERPPRLRRAQGDGRGARPRGAGRRRRGRAGARFRRAGRARLRAGMPAFPSSSASSATTMSGAPSSSRPSRIRELGVRMKHNANRAVVEGKRIVLIDDSHRARHHLGEDRADDARGRRDARCTSASPARRSRYPDFYGIDTPERDKLLAATHDLEEMRALYRLRLASPSSRSTGIYRAMGEEAPRSAPPAVHRPLLHRRLPDPLSDVDGTSDRFGQGGPKQLSLLAEAG